MAAKRKRIRSTASCITQEASPSKTAVLSATPNCNQKEDSLNTGWYLESDLDLENASPAEKYRAFKASSKFQTKYLLAFSQKQDFPLDAFQLQALRAVEDGQTTLVAAPTGAGKTLVGEFALFVALQRGKRAFYTTPIKALSNQKYRDFAASYGREQVGLLTGDTTINPHAPIVVMTTEVLRNMLYRNDKRLTQLEYVILDEVHYLADRFRGPVWEEVILNLDLRVSIVALSATVSNAEEFGAWLQAVRGRSAVIVSEQRPVPLTQHLFVQGKLYDLQRKTKNGPKLNPALVSAVENTHKVARQQNIQLLEELAQRALLPAIFFIFSRSGVNQAIDELLAAGIDLTSKAEKDQINTYIDAAFQNLSANEWEILGMERASLALQRGIAPHHAGLLPIFKELVEELFSAGLIKVVFATETLALGINMPARSVVIQSLKKWDGQEFRLLTAGQYTQLTGRAGRRGIDRQGHAIVAYHPGITPAVVASLASKRTYPLYSAFQPTYNMSVNLLESYSPTQTRDILQRSFAQFQVDAGMVKKAIQAREKHSEADRILSTGLLECEFGDAYEYARLCQELERRDQKQLAQLRRQQLSALKQFLNSLRPGDILHYSDGKRWRYGVVMHIDRSGIPEIEVLRSDGRPRTLSAHQVRSELQLIGSMQVKGYSINKPRDRKEVASRLRALLRAGLVCGTDNQPEENRLYASADHGTDQNQPHLGDQVDETEARLPRPREISLEAGVSAVGAAQKLQAEIKGKQLDQLTLEQLHYLLSTHPVSRCPNAKRHLQKASRPLRLERQADKLIRQVADSKQSLAKSFDQICQVLQTLGYLDQQLQLTEAGKILSRLHCEQDLLLAQCVRQNTFEVDTPADLVAIIAGAIYLPRKENDQPPLSARLENHAWRIEKVAQQLAEVQTRFGADVVPPRSTGLMSAAYSWAKGETLSKALDLSGLEAGDFVRAMKQLLDVLRQLQLVGSVSLSEQAYAATKLIQRGVVAWSDV